jgi:hypothetical protein
MLRKFILLGILTSIIQILLFGLLHKLAVHVHEVFFHYSPHNDLNWGISLHYTVILYGFLVATINLLLTFSGIRKRSIIILFILLIVFDIWLFQYFQYRPYNVILIFTLFHTLLVLSFAVEKYLSKTLSKKTDN